MDTILKSCPKSSPHCKPQAFLTSAHQKAELPRKQTPASCESANLHEQGKRTIQHILYSPGTTAPWRADRGRCCASPCPDSWPAGCRGQLSVGPETGQSPGRRWNSRAFYESSRAAAASIAPGGMGGKWRREICYLNVCVFTFCGKAFCLHEKQIFFRAFYEKSQIFPDNDQSNLHKRNASPRSTFFFSIWA